MTIRLRLIASLTVLSLAGLLFARWYTTPAPPVEPDFMSLPEKIGEWTATATEMLSGEAFAALEPDSYLLRRYEAPERAPIWVYIGLYARRAGYGKGAHDPRVCFPAQGWEVSELRPFTVDLPDDEKLGAHLLVAQRGGAHETALYWFQPANRWPGAPLWEDLMRVADAVAGRPQYAFVRITASTQYAGDETEAQLVEFARVAARSIRANVDRVTRGKPAFLVAGSEEPNAAGR